jgi:hypothetical protein
MLNSASKYLKITLKVIKFSKPEKNSQKTQVDDPPHVKFMLGMPGGKSTHCMKP